MLHTGMGALHWAAAMGDEPCLVFLRERAVNVDALSWAGLSPLAYAARAGHAGAVRLLLADANPNVGTLSSRTRACMLPHVVVSCGRC